VSIPLLRAMTWNLWWRFGPWEARHRAIVAVLQREAPDIVCLQEVHGEDGGTDQAAALAGELGLHAAATDGPYFDGLSFGNAVLSRWPIVGVTEHALPRADGTPGHRRALAAVLDTPYGRWPVVSTHLDHRFDASATRQLQCATLLELVDGVRNPPEDGPPTIVGGDLNAVPDSDEIRLLTGRRASMIPNLVLSDCWEQAGDGPGCTWQRRNPYVAGSAWPERRIDYLLVSWPRPKPLGNAVRAWLAGAEPVEGVQPSDHAAVVVDLQVT
jgi:endonuclease/exonuclease/phosphatase family metal-dependent hydrolase